MVEWVGTKVVQAERLIANLTGQMIGQICLSSGGKFGKKAASKPL